MHNQMPKKAVRFVLKNGPAKSEISWPILAETQRAVQVETEVGDIWLPRTFAIPSTARIITIDTLANFIRGLRELTRAEGLVPLKRWKKGPAPGMITTEVQTVVSRNDQDEGQLRTRMISFPDDKLVAMRCCDDDVDLWGVKVWVVQKALERSARYLADKRRSIRFSANERLADPPDWLGVRVCHEDFFKELAILEGRRVHSDPVKAWAYTWELIEGFELREMR